jgi:hypothetical protein
MTSQTTYRNSVVGRLGEGGMFAVVVLFEIPAFVNRRTSKLRLDSERPSHTAAGATSGPAVASTRTSPLTMTSAVAAAGRELGGP